MTKKSKKYVSFLVASVMAMLTACNKDTGVRNPCLEPRQYFLWMQMRTEADTGSAGVEYKLPAPVIGYVDTNIIFSDGKTSFSEIKGPLSGIADSTRWFIMPDTAKKTETDTIVFYYNRKPVFLSTACGYTFTYSLTHFRATNYLLDSVRIEKTEVNSATDVVHVKVFY